MSPDFFQFLIICLMVFSEMSLPLNLRVASMRSVRVKVIGRLS